ncbi:MAG TPA: divergent polysaccharide deacetylase family protein, partial [Acetobacteraceae bacterium]|nr:divergent polysaccharide deacetylase family protein [Acetobacteraceae bacterium]
PAPAPSPPRAPPFDGRIASPDPALLEPSRAFPPAMLPRVAPDGRTPRVVYARRFDPADKRPRIGIILAGLGMSEADSRMAIDTLPGAVTLAFSPYVNNPDPLLDQARGRGHEMLISVPMEPQGYPLNDAGSRSLLTGADAAQNRANLEWALSRIQGYVGATGAFEGMRGERFAEQTVGLTAALEDVGKRGLLYIDPRPGRTAPGPAGLPSRAVDVVIDDPPARAEIEAKLAALERLAREKGSALGLAGPVRPVTVERIASWARGLEERGLVLAPVTAILEPPPK